MPTVTKKIADDIVAGDGYYTDDPRVLRIIEYSNKYNGKLAYGLIYERMDPDTYKESEYVLNPKVYWEAKKG